MAQFIIEGIGERDLYYETKSLENFLGTFCDSDLVELRDLLLREFPVPLNEHERQRLAEMNVELFSRVEKILRRERIATAVLAGFAANQVCDPMAKPNVATAIVWADALIAALDKEA